MKHIWQTLTVFFCVLWVVTILGLRPAPIQAEAGPSMRNLPLAKIIVVARTKACLPDTCVLPSRIRPSHHKAIWK